MIQVLERNATDITHFSVECSSNSETGAIIGSTWFCVQNGDTGHNWRLATMKDKFQFEKEKAQASGLKNVKKDVLIPVRNIKTFPNLTA